MPTERQLDIILESELEFQTFHQQNNAMDKQQNNTLPEAQNQIMVVFNPEGLVVLAGKPRKLTAKECREYMQPGWKVETMALATYKQAKYKWIYETGQEPSSEDD